MTGLRGGGLDCKPAPVRRDSLAAALKCGDMLPVEIVHQRGLKVIFESERRATLADAENPEALEEMRLWEATIEDGIDLDLAVPAQEGRASAS